MIGNKHIKNILLSALIFLMQPFLGCDSEPSHFLPPTGHIFTARTLMHLGFDNINFDAHRHSSHSVTGDDSQNVIGFYKRCHTDTGNIFVTDYYIPTLNGVQYQFLVPGKAKFWVNSGSLLNLYYTDKRLAPPSLLEGECCVEAMDSLTITVEDSLSIFLTKGSCVNIQNFQGQPAVRVSLVRGSLNINADYGIAATHCSVNQTGMEVFMNKKHGIGSYSLFDTLQLVSWRNAEYLLHYDTSFSEVMRKLNSWYGTSLVIKIGSEIPSSKRPLHLSYETALDSALKKIEDAFEVRLQRENEKISAYLR